MVPELVRVEVESLGWVKRLEKERRVSKQAAVDPGGPYVGPKVGTTKERGQPKDVVKVEVHEGTGDVMKVTSDDGTEPPNPADLEEVDGKLFRWRATHILTFSLRTEDGRQEELVRTEPFSVRAHVMEMVEACGPGAQCQLELDDRNRPYALRPKSE